MMPLILNSRIIEIVNYPPNPSWRIKVYGRAFCTSSMYYININLN